MSIVLANAWKPTLLDTERSTLNGYYYGLFVNNLTPTGANILADFTECTDGGYISTGRQHPVFTAAYLNGSNQGELDGATLTWTFSYSGGGFTVYGYFCATAGSGGALVFSERATAPFTVTAAGQIYVVVPKKLMDTM